MSKKNCLFLILEVFFLCIFYINPHGAAEKPERDLKLFNAQYVLRLESEIKTLKGFQRLRLISQLGKLALYARLYRSWVRNPRSGLSGFDKHFPEPPVVFHSWVYDDCSTKISLCVNTIFDNIRNRTAILFPARRQAAGVFPLEPDVFVRSVTNKMFAYDVSVSYLMCFLTMNRLSILKYLPFCTYGIEDNQKHQWPAGRFQDASSRTNIFHGDQSLGPDPFDHFLGQAEFQCADESFCPDPCCGRRSARSSSAERFCIHSTCMDNVVAAESRLLTSKSVNLSEASHSCHVDAFLNDDLLGIMENRWNLSCACVLVRDDISNGEAQNTAKVELDLTKVYRAELHQCVDIDECLYTKCSKANEECVNTVGSYACVCKAGYVRVGTSRRHRCEQLEFDPIQLWTESNSEMITPK